MVSHWGESGSTLGRELPIYQSFSDPFKLISARATETLFSFVLFSLLMAIDSEWNSAFIGKPKATKFETIMGIEVAPGTSISDFKKTAAELLFPKDEQLPAGVTPTGKAEPAPRKNTGLPLFRTNIGGKLITVERE